jgi:hypothetical protein
VPFSKLSINLCIVAVSLLKNLYRTSSINSNSSAEIVLVSIYASFDASSGIISLLQEMIIKIGK